MIHRGTLVVISHRFLLTESPTLGRGGSSPGAASRACACACPLSVFNRAFAVVHQSSSSQSTEDFIFVQFRSSYVLRYRAPDELVPKSVRNETTPSIRRARHKPGTSHGLRRPRVSGTTILGAEFRLSFPSGVLKLWECLIASILRHGRLIRKVMSMPLLTFPGETPLWPEFDK